MENEKIEEIVTEFFSKRFPKKEIAFEKQCGYFGEWVDRFKSGSPESYMDAESLKVWREMKESGQQMAALNPFKELVKMLVEDFKKYGYVYEYGQMFLDTKYSKQLVGRLK